MQAAGAEQPSISPRLAADFLQQMPTMFRDPLPARAALFANRVVVLQALGPVAYGDVTAWLHGEPAVRLPLSKQWRGRAADSAFRAEVAANLAAHTEWERVLYPERFLPKKPRPLPPPPEQPAVGQGGKPDQPNEIATQNRP